MMKRILGFLFVFFLFFGCTKEEFGSISGLIYDPETITPKAGVTVELSYDLAYCSFPDKCKHKETILSDSKGEFSFTDLEEGTYTLRIVVGKSQQWDDDNDDWVWGNGYLEKKIELSAGAQMELDIPYTKN